MLGILLCLLICGVFRRYFEKGALQEINAVERKLNLQEDYWLTNAESISQLLFCLSQYSAHLNLTATTITSFGSASTPKGISYNVIIEKL